MALHPNSSNTAPILALPAIALAGQSAATYFMDSGRAAGRSPGGPGPGTDGPGGPDGGIPAKALRTLPQRNRPGAFGSGNQKDKGDALAA